MSIKITPELHRSLGVSLFNEVWNLIDKKNRNSEDNELMINTAHASLFHWMQVGEPVNFARGEWQVSRVYSICKRAEPALHHAENTLRICLQNGIGDFDLAFAYEALARAHAVENHVEKVAEYRTLGLAAAQSIEKKEDRDYFMAELSSIISE
jgi:hypothetical protein